MTIHQRVRFRGGVNQEPTRLIRLAAAVTLSEVRKTEHPPSVSRNPTYREKPCVPRVRRAEPAKRGFDMSLRTGSRARRVLSTFTAAASIATGFIAGAFPAQAAYVGHVAFNGSNIVLEADLGDTFSFDNYTGSAVTIENVVGSGSVSTSPGGAACTGATCSAGPSGSITLRVDAYGTVNLVGPTRTLTLVAPTSAPTPSGVSAPPPPAVFTLTWARDDGGYCTTESQSADEGSWITLPAVQDCTPPAKKPKASLLGWSTTPDFPIAIAKRQVDNGYAAYETTDKDGLITSLFIPAGGQTYLTWNNTLYPIWSE